MAKMKVKVLSAIPGYAKGQTVMIDTDQDGIGDLVESLIDFDPLVPDMPTACAQVDPFADSDMDGLSDCDEALLGTEPSLVDTDGDGLPDRLELVAQTDYLHDDAETDSEGDGTTNGEEVKIHTDPRSVDPQAQRMNVAATAQITPARRESGSLMTKPEEAFAPRKSARRAAETGC